MINGGSFYSALAGTDILTGMDKYIYFDHGATTPFLPEVAEEINSCFTGYYGNASEQARGSLRITLGFENTLEEVEYFLEILPGIISDLRDISPLYKKR